MGMNHGIIQALTQTPPPEHIKAVAGILKTPRGLELARISALNAGCTLADVLPKSVSLPTACMAGKAA